MMKVFDFIGSTRSETCDLHTAEYYRHSRKVVIIYRF